MIDAGTTRPILYGATYSVYVRIARLVLLEKGIDHDHVEVDIFAKDGPPADYLKRHPFGRIPSFSHGGVDLYETGAIARYIDEAFAGSPLQPADAVQRARMNQVVSVLDNYLYRPLVWGIYVACVEKGGEAGDAAIADAAAKASHCLDVIEAGMGEWLAGDALTLADLYAAPMIAYGLMTEQGRGMLAARPRLGAWWSQVSARPSMLATRFAAEMAN